MKKFKKYFWRILAIVCVTFLTLPVILDKETEVLNPENRKEAPGAFIRLSGGITHYEEYGHGKAQTVLLVAGLSVPYYIWDTTFKFLKENGFHVIRYDLFGRGYSDRPDVVYNNELFIGQITDLLAALTIDEPVDIFGLSMGGPIVAEFTHRYPGKVRKVVLIGPVNEPASTSVLKVPVLGNFLMELFFAQRQSGDFFKPEEHPDWPDKFRPQMKYKGFKRAIRSTLIHYMSQDKLPAYKKLGELDKQVLLIWGENDQTTPFEGNVRIREVVKCDFLNVPEAGHLPHLEHPESVHSKIIEFLNEE